jgi:hypothetical protein
VKAAGEEKILPTAVVTVTFTVRCLAFVGTRHLMRASLQEMCVAHFVAPDVTPRSAPRTAPATRGAACSHAEGMCCRLVQPLRHGYEPAVLTCPDRRRRDSGVTEAAR